MCVFMQDASTPILIMANKQDLDNSIDCRIFIDNIGLEYSLNNKHIPFKNWDVIGTSAVTGAGTFEGIDLLYRMILKRKTFLKGHP